MRGNKRPTTVSLALILAAAALGAAAAQPNAQKVAAPLPDYLLAAGALKSGRLFLLSSKPLDQTSMLRLYALASRHDSYAVLAECVKHPPELRLMQLPLRDPRQGAVQILVLSPSGGIYATGRVPEQLEGVVTTTPLPSYLWDLLARPVLDALNMAGRVCP